MQRKGLSMRIYFSDQHAVHAPGAFVSRGQVTANPEKPARAEALLRAAREAGHELASIKDFGLAPVQAVHDTDYLSFLEHAWRDWSALADHAPEVIPNVHPGRNMGARPRAIVGRAGYYQADCACPIGPGTWEGIQVSANCALSAASQVVGSSGADYAYALCRPPGHHAYADMAGGFCFLNNTAIAAQYCRDQGAAKVAIVDVDVHHGNGTQGIFYARDDVLTVSLHGDPAEFYPFFAGYRDEVGEGNGQGCNINIPLARDTGDDVFMEHLRQVLGKVRDFQPDVLLIALGLDASEHDPLAFMKITAKGFQRIGEALGAIGLPTVIVQEGGYLSEQLGGNLVAALAGFETAR
jgi:acetoin utilization deacetylase AcuC-like enzyme